MSVICIFTPCVEFLEMRTKEYRAARELALHPKATWKHAQAADLALHAMLEAIDVVCSGEWEESPPLLPEYPDAIAKDILQYLRNEFGFAFDMDEHGAYPDYDKARKAIAGMIEGV